MLFMLWLFVRPFTFPPAVRVEHIDGEIELELSDSRVFRYVRHVWIKFPEGTKPDAELACWLYDERDRLKSLDRWSRGGSA